jgi:uncharacterized protein (DUF736 family)
MKTAMAASSGALHLAELVHTKQGKVIPMACIGAFTRIANSYSGCLRTLGLDVEFTIVPADRDDMENAPDSRVHLGRSADAPAIGASRTRTGEKVEDYISLLINDPVIAQPIRVRLFKADAKGSTFHLRSNRRSESDERA